MSMKNFTKLALIGGLAVSLTLAGCGNRNPANPIEEEEPAAENPAPKPSTAAPEPAPPTAPAPVQPTTPAYTAPTTGSLVVSGVEKSKKGFLFKNMIVKGSVVNTSNVPLSGTLKVEFKDKKGLFTKTLVTEETRTQVIAMLQPGQSFPFEITSEKTGLDEAEVTVETMPAPAGATAAGYPAGNPYGAPAAAGYPQVGAQGRPY